MKHTPDMEKQSLGWKSQPPTDFRPPKVIFDRELEIVRIKETLLTIAYGANPHTVMAVYAHAEGIEQVIQSRSFGLKFPLRLLAPPFPLLAQSFHRLSPA